MVTVPYIVFKTRVRDESVDGSDSFHWQKLTTPELFGGKRVVLFAVPEAFHPVCSSQPLPHYEELYDEIRAQGVDEVFCLTIADVSVMFEWGQKLGIKKVFLLPDESGHFTRQMGMLVSQDNFALGMRSWRYSMVVDDGAIEKIYPEPGYSDNCETDLLTVSDADTMLSYLKSIRNDT